MIVKNMIIRSLLFTLLMVFPLSAQINFVQENYTTSNPSSSSVVVAYPAGADSGKLKYCSGGVERHQRCSEIGHRQPREQLYPGGTSHGGHSADAGDTTPRTSPVAAT